jgi:hypothetical protein
VFKLGDQPAVARPAAAVTVPEARMAPVKQERQAEAALAEWEEF